MFKINDQDIDEEAKKMAQLEIQESIENQIKECKISIMDKAKNFYKTTFEIMIKKSYPAFQLTTTLSESELTNEWAEIEAINERLKALEYINTKNIFK